MFCAALRVFVAPLLASAAVQMASGARAAGFGAPIGGGRHAAPALPAALGIGQAHPIVMAPQDEPGTDRPMPAGGASIRLNPQFGAAIGWDPPDDPARSGAGWRRAMPDLILAILLDETLAKSSPAILPLPADLPSRTAPPPR